MTDDETDFEALEKIADQDKPRTDTSVCLCTHPNRCRHFREGYCDGFERREQVSDEPYDLVDQLDRMSDFDGDFHD